MIFELFGIPGSGKTTMCKKLDNDKGYKNIMFFYRESFVGKVIYQLFLRFFVFNKKLRLMYNEINVILKDYLENDNIISKDVKLDLFIKYIIFVCYIESKYYKYNVCVDEGILHLCIAIYAEFGVPLQVLERIMYLTSNKNNIRYILINCEIEKAMLQIKRRNRKRAPIDFITDDELRKLLFRYKTAEEYFSLRYIDKCEV